MDGLCSRALARLPVSGFLLVLAAAYPLTGACAAPSVEAFANLPEQSLPVLTHDGHFIAYLDRKGPQPKVVIFNLATRQAERAFGVPDGSRIDNLRWNDNETLLISMGQTRVRKSRYDRPYQLYRTLAVGATSGTPQFIPVADNVKHTSLPAAIIGAAQSSKPHTVIMRMEVFCKEHCIAEVDTETGKITPLTIGNRHTVDWVVGREGRPVARVDWDYKAHTYQLFALNGNSIKEIYRRDDTERPVTAGVLADGSGVVMLTTNGRPHSAAWAFPFDGSAPRLLVEEPDDDIVQSYVDGRAGVVIGVYVSGENSTVHWLDAAAQARFDAAQRAFPGKHVVIYGWTDDGQKLLARVQAGTAPPIVYLIDLAKHTADVATEEYPALAGVKLGEVKTLRYSARDGTQIPAYLTTPPEPSKGPQPMIVLVHAEVFSRDYPLFNWFAQYFASRGYAVLQPQFRGSTGFGAAFHEAGFKQWGGLMQDDVSDGVQAMVRDGVADPKRICIIGEEDAGFFALAGAAFTPELYACAVSINGISDLQETMRNFGDPGFWLSTQQSYWRAHMGDAHDPLLAQRSPINAVKNVQHPILIAFHPVPGHPGDTQSEKMARKLKDAGKAYESLELDVDEYWSTSSAQRVRVLSAVESFVSANTRSAN